MRAFSSMTIGRKMLLAFAGIGLASAILGGYSLYTLRGLGATVSSLVDVSARQAILPLRIDVLKSDMLSRQRAMILWTYAKDGAKMDSTREDFLRHVGDAETLLRDLVKLGRNPREEQLARSIGASLERWKPAFLEVADLCRAGATEVAWKVAVEKTFPLYQSIETEATELVKLSEAEMKRDKAESEARASGAVWLTSGLLGVVLLIGGVSGAVVAGIARELRGVTSDLSGAASQLAGASGQIAAAAGGLAQGASEQAAALEEVSSSSDEINAMARQNSEHSKSAAEKVQRSSGQVERADQSLGLMVAAMDEIAGSSDRIARIIKVIDEIAFQTNILALNAAVEAARAGEAGMGFAVVAEEVRNLAHRSAQAARDTAALIEESIAKSRDGKGKVSEVAAAIAEVTRDSVQVKTLVEEVSCGSEEQRRGIEQIAQTILEMQRVTQKTAAGAEESASAAEELKAQAQTLRDVVGRLTEMVGASAA